MDKEMNELDLTPFEIKKDDKFTWKNINPGYIVEILTEYKSTLVIRINSESLKFVCLSSGCQIRIDKHNKKIKIGRVYELPYYVTMKDLQENPLCKN